MENIPSGLSGDKTSRCAIRNSRHLELPRERHQLIYAHSLNVTEEDLISKESFFGNNNNNDFLRSSLGNEWVSVAMAFYYDRDHGSDLLAWWSLISYRRRMLKGRLGRLSLDNIFTTGLPRGDADRYHSP